MMRAISLWQPYASAIALGYKTIETRHWSTKYRGRLAIHAAQRQTAELRALAATYDMVDLPFGAIVATATLIDICGTEDIRPFVGEREADFGDYATGRFAWMLIDIEPVLPAVPWRGGQGFFNVTLPTPCRYCGPGMITGLPGNACENCMNTGWEDGGR